MARNMTKCVTTIFQIVNFVKFHSKCCDKKNTGIPLTAKKEKSCPRQKRFAVHTNIPTRSFFPFLYNLQQIKRKLYKQDQVFIFVSLSTCRSCMMQSCTIHSEHFLFLRK